ncbi:hypothetical protein [Flavobacterium sp.]|jgi:hypothetical protein|uniref:hypothetical protein n=1 Tax=Flavobacterium sp. TaxID=239 RepID=UPI0037C043DA
MKYKFEKWMHQVCKYAPVTVIAYSRSIDMLSEHLTQQKGKRINIFELDDKNLLKEIADLYSLKGKYSRFGDIGHGTYRNGIAAYVRFYNYFYSSTKTEKVEIEKKHENSVEGTSSQNVITLEKTINNKWISTKKIFIELWNLWFGNKTSSNKTVKNPNARLPIILIPNDIEKFKKILLINKQASITTYYKDGKHIKKYWTAENMTSDSNILGNLRSRPEFRKENWQKLKIEKVVVEVNEAKEYSIPENYHIQLANKKEKLDDEKAYTKLSKQLEHKNAYEKWTSEDDEKLEILFCEGKTVSELSEIFKRNPGAIRSRINKLELKEKYD